MDEYFTLYSSSATHLTLQQDSSTGYKIMFADNGGNKESINHDISLNEWHHISICFTGLNSSKSCDIYIDKSFIKTSDNFDANTFSASQNDTKLYIGGYVGNERSMGGYIDDFRIYDKALSASEVSQIYQATNPYPGYYNHTADLVAWYKFDGDFKDSSGNGNDLTAINSPTLNKNSVRGTRSVKFDGKDNDDKLTLSNIQLSDENTFTWWFNYDKASSDTYGMFFIISTSHGGTTYSAHAEIGDDTQTSHIIVKTWKGSSSYPITYNSLSQNTWNHAAWTINTVSGEWKLYVNGNEVGTLTDTNNTILANINYTFYMGANSPDTQSLSGYIDDFRIYNKALSAEQVKQIYGYTIQRQQGHISPYSYFFNGISGMSEDNAYIHRKVSDFPTDFTVSFWKKSMDTTHTDTTFALRPSGGSTDTVNISIADNVVYKVGSTTHTISSYNDESWHHWAFSYNGTDGTMDIFRDGMNRIGANLNKFTGSASAITADADYIVLVGGDDKYDASQGYLEDFRIYSKALTPVGTTQHV